MGTILKGPSIREAEKHCPGALVGTFIAKFWNGVRQGKLGLEIKNQTKPPQNEQPKNLWAKLRSCISVQKFKSETPQGAAGHRLGRASPETSGCRGRHPSVGIHVTQE